MDVYPNLAQEEVLPLDENRENNIQPVLEYQIEKIELKGSVFTFEHIEIMDIKYGPAEKVGGCNFIYLL